MEGSLGWKVELNEDVEVEEELGSFGAKDDDGSMGIVGLIGDREGSRGWMIDELFSLLLFFFLLLFGERFVGRGGEEL